MPYALFVHLRRGDLNALVGDVIDAVTKALFAEFFFDVDTGRLQVKRFARGAVGGAQVAITGLFDPLSPRERGSNRPVITP